MNRTMELVSLFTATEKFVTLRLSRSAPFRGTYRLEANARRFTNPNVVIVAAGYGFEGGSATYDFVHWMCRRQLWFVLVAGIVTVGSDSSSCSKSSDCKYTTKNRTNLSHCIFSHFNSYRYCFALRRAIFLVAGKLCSAVYK